MSMLERLAAAPITWGVDGSLGWGHLMDPDRVLAEMVEVGLVATELGPDGYLGSTSDAVLRRLDRHGLELVGGFVPTVLYDPGVIDGQLEFFERGASILAAGGAEVVVLGADSHLAGYDEQISLSDRQWEVFFDHLGRIDRIADHLGLRLALHPHWGMAVEDQSDVDRVIERSDVGFCLDTGHLALAGVDMAGLVERAAGRIHHVHLKDLDLEVARRVRRGDIRFRQAVIDGMFLPLGMGGADIAAVVRSLEATGFSGWYVLEQDTALERDPRPGTGPVEAARQSMEFLRALATQVGAPREDGGHVVTEQGPTQGVG